MKGIENEGLVFREGRLGHILILTSENFEHNLFFIGNGSNDMSLPYVKN